MSSVAFLVDGDLEKRALAKICKGSPIRHLGNGDNFPMSVIVKQIMTHVRVLNNRYSHIAILYDLERRDDTFQNFGSAISSALVAAGIGSQSFSVHIKDRTAEDWILSDRQTLQAFLGHPIPPGTYSGKGGLKQLLRQANVNYSEVPLGAELLASVICSQASMHSPSLESFRDTFGRPCWWLDR